MKKEKDKISLRRFIPLFILIIFMIIAYVSELTDYIKFEALKENRKLLKNYVVSYWWLTSILFIILYITITALSIPGAVFITLFGGFLFGQPYSTIYVVVGASVGACIIFLVAKSAIGEFFKKKVGKRLEKMRTGFQENAVSYLLFLRLVPLFPFWIVNIAPAFFGVNLWTFLWTTVIGIIPGAFVYAQAGAGLGAILDTGEEFSINAIFNWQLKIALVALGVFAMLPIIIKKIRQKKHAR